MSDKKPDWNYREKRSARMDGATTVSNSGRGFRKGDATLDDWLIDYKHNELTFTLKATAWAKHAKDAWNENQRKPLIKVVYGDGRAVAIIDWDDFVELRKD